MTPIETLFEWLLTATLRASALAAVILGIQFFLHHRLPAAWRYALWLPMLAVLVLPVLPEAPFGLLPQKAEQPAAVVLSEMPVTRPKTVFESPAAPSMGSGTTPVVTAQLNYSAMVWLTGFCVVLAAGAIGYRRNMHRIRSNASAPDRKLQAAIEEAAEKAGLKRAPQTLISPAVASPAVTGLVRPVLLLPTGFPKGFSAVEARLILLHEFTHLKRFDLPLNWLLCVLQAMHWFNPLLWFAFARMRADREAACDARVLSIDTTDRRSEYGGALLKLQCVTPSRFLSLGFVGIYERGSGIKSRIQGISNYRSDRFGWKVAGGTILTLLMLFGVTQGQQPDPATDGKEQQEGNVPPGVSQNPSGKEKIQQQLNSIVSSFSFSGATVEEAFQLLHHHTQGLDASEPDPKKRGVKFVLRLPDPAQALWQRQNTTPVQRHIMEFRNLPLSAVVDAICKSSNLDYAVDDHAVIISPKENAVTNPAVGENPTANELLLKKLSSIVIPSINFNNATVAEVFQFLRQKTQELDPTETNPKKRGVKFEIQPPDSVAGKPENGAKITLQLQNAPLLTALQYICEAADLSYIVIASDDAVIIFPGKKGALNPAAPENSPAKESLQKKINSIIIPSINFTDASVADAIQFLRQRSQALDTSEPDPQKRGVNFALGLPESSPADPKITLQLQNAPLLKALQLICDAGNLQYTVGDHTVTISPKEK